MEPKLSPERWYEKVFELSIKSSPVYIQTDIKITWYGDNRPEIKKYFISLIWDGLEGRNCEIFENESWIDCFSQCRDYLTQNKNV